jgi:hypothetical protein
VPFFECDRPHEAAERFFLRDLPAELECDDKPRGEGGVTSPICDGAIQAFLNGVYTQLPFIARSSKALAFLGPLFLYTSQLALYTLFRLIAEGSKRYALLRSLGNM